MRKPVYALIGAALIIFGAAAQARADDQNGPEPYAKFIDGAQSQGGLFTVWRKNQKVFLELRKDQLDTDFVQSAVPVNGLGGFGIYPGAFDYAPARLIRFSRIGDTVKITWPNTFVKATPGSAAENAIKSTFANSNVGLAHVVAVDETSGDIVIDMDAFLGDVMDLADNLKFALGTGPEDSYRLDDHSASFGATKSFPKNVFIEVNQDWQTDKPDVVDNVPDPRSIEFRIDYNIAAAPDDGYMPRLADDRVGFWDNAYLDYSTDRAETRQIHYIFRWNFKPEDPSKPSNATNPMVFYLSNTIPSQYRPAIHDGLMEWNKALAAAGILNAVQVKDQPDDPTWDPDDIRYNVVRWLTESNGGGFAEAQAMVDPRTGEEFHSGILFDADLMRGIYQDWRNVVGPARRFGSSGFSGTETDYGRGMQRQYAFGKLALAITNGSYSQDQYAYDFLKSIAMHESGHDMGLQHNFIGSQTYTSNQIRSRQFTSQHGVSTSVMDYLPVNVWPKGMSTGDYWQRSLGSYDYHVIHYGYAAIPGAKSPHDELATLHAWASDWANPLHRLASDEDVSWGNAHAIDPRVNQFDLTNDPLDWTASQLTLDHSLLQSLDRRLPQNGQAYESVRNAFEAILLNSYMPDAEMAEHYIGGEYLSRSHAGDPNAASPLIPISRADEARAWNALDQHLFSDGAWRFSPAMLNRTTYQEFESNQASWAYHPHPRHDAPLAEIVGGEQLFVLNEVFQPLMLQRLESLSLRTTPGRTMSTSDLFDWAQRSVYGDLSARAVGSLPAIRRNLQSSYEGLLTHLAISPEAGTPSGAQALARAKLVDLASALHRLHASTSMDEETRAHLAMLQARVSQALNAQIVLPTE